MMNEEKYVFISYKSEEIDKAREIQHFLEENGCKCWRAPESLNDRGTQDYSSDIFDAIRRCSCLLFVLSNRALCSDWVRKEVKYALERCHKPIIPYVVGRIPVAKYETDELMISLSLQKQLLNENLSGDMSVILPYVKTLNVSTEAAENLDGKSNKKNAYKMAREDFDRLESEADFHLKRLEELCHINYFTCGNDYPFRICKREKESCACIAAKRLITAAAAFSNGAIDIDAARVRGVLSKLYRLTYRFGECFTDEVFTLVDQFVMCEDPVPWACFVTHVKYYRPLTCGVDSGDLAHKMLAISVRDDDNPYADIRMGICCKWGMGREVSGIAAEYWYERALEHGCNEVWRWLGDLYEYGVCDIKIDKKKSKDYYQKGIKAQDSSCYELMFWALFDFNASNNDEAFDYLCKGCENGEERALSIVADCFDQINTERVAKYGVSCEDMRWRALCVNNPAYRTRLAYAKFNEYHSDGNAGKLNVAFDHLASGISQRNADCSDLMGDLMLIDVSRKLEALGRTDMCPSDSSLAFKESLEFVRSELGHEKNPQARFIMRVVEECEKEFMGDRAKMKRRVAALDWYRYFANENTPCSDSPFWISLTDCWSNGGETHLFAENNSPSRLATFSFLTPYRLLNSLFCYPARPDSDLSIVQKIWKLLRSLDYEQVDVDQIRKGQGAYLTTGAARSSLDRIRRVGNIYSELSRLIFEPNKYAQLAREFHSLEGRVESSFGEDFSEEILQMLNDGQAEAESLTKNSKMVRIAFLLAQEEFRCSHPQLDIALDCYRIAFAQANSPRVAVKLATLFFVNNARFRSEEASESVIYSVRDALFKAVDMRKVEAIPLFLETALFGAKVGASSIEPDFQAIIKAEPVIESMTHEGDNQVKDLVFKIKIACAMAKIFMDPTLYCAARCEQQWGVTTLLDRAKAVLWLRRAKELCNEAVQKLETDSSFGDEVFLSESFQNELKRQRQRLEEFGRIGEMSEVLGNSSVQESESNEIPNDYRPVAEMYEKVEAEIQSLKDRLSFFPHVLLEGKMADMSIASSTNALLLKMALHEDVQSLVGDLMCLRETLQKMEPESKVAIGIVCRPEHYESICHSIKVEDVHVFKIGALKQDIEDVFVGFGDLMDEVEAAMKCRKNAEEGQMEAQCEMGWRCQNGTGVEKDLAQAVAWYRKAAEQGYSVAQFDMGVMYDNGWGVEKDGAEAVVWYQKAAEQGNADAQFNLGYAYENGNGVMQDLEEAIKWYLKAAEQDDANAQFNLGCMYDNGQGVTQDSEEAVAWYRKAAEQGHVDAQFNLGYAYEHGKGVAQDLEEAVKWYRMAAEQGYAGAQVNLGYAYECGEGVGQDLEEAVKWYQKAAEQGEAVAQCNLGYMYECGAGIAPDLEEAVTWYRKAAEQGHARAQFNLGYMYEDGKGVVQDDEEAANWYRRAAENGHAGAQRELGWRYQNGKGVEKNLERAVAWYRKAAEQGYSVAQFDMGVMCDNGLGVEKNVTEAVRWYRKAAVQGHADAQFNLGCAYEVGEGVTQDFEEAIRWYRKAAKQGYVRAQFSLGMMYGNGQGVEKNDAEGARWYRMAAEQGHAGAQTNLGCAYEYGEGVGQDLEEAVKWYRKAAEQGEAVAQCNLGYMYERGEGIASDFEEAITWYRKAAEQEYARAQFNLGYMYEDGKGVAQNDEEAVNWYSRAAENGHVGAQREMGWRYQNGKGVEKNLEQAVAWYRKAAEQRYSVAQFDMGVMYDNGWGVEKNVAEAVKWYRKAAEQGNADAQFNLGYDYEHGEGVRQNVKEAAKWYRKAAAQGHEKAKLALADLSK